MRKSIKLLSAALLAGAATFVASCGTGGESSSLGSDEQVGTASLSVAVKFPNGITPQYIDNDIQCIEVSYYRGMVERHVVLTPDNPTGTIENIVPGRARIEVRATDAYYQDNDTGEVYCEGNEMDFVKVFAEIKEGVNNLVTTLIAPAKWKLVDNNDEPVEIVFNKIKTDSTERISSFNIMTWSMEGPHYASLDFTKPAGVSSYKVAFKGNDMYVDNDLEYGCVSSDTCITEGLYFNQFIGPDISKNAFETEPVALAPVQVGNDMLHREFWIMGTKPMYDEMPDEFEDNVIRTFKAIQADNTDIIQDFENRFGYTKVSDATHMEGAIIEILEKGKNVDIVCSLDKDGNNIIDCPPALTNNMPDMDNDGYNDNGGSDNDMFGGNDQTFDNDNYSGNDMTGGNDMIGDNDNFGGNDQIGPSSIDIAAIDDNDCYRDVNVIEQEVVDYLNSPFAYCEPIPTTPFYCDYNMDGVINDNDDINGDGFVNDNDNYYIIRRTTTLTDVCVYPFRAKAEKLPETIGNITIQNK